MKCALEKQAADVSTGSIILVTSVCIMFIKVKINDEIIDKEFNFLSFIEYILKLLLKECKTYFNRIYLVIAMFLPGQS